MRHSVWPAVAVLVCLGGAVSGETAPVDVKWTEDGAIEASLTGAAGNAEAGGKVMSNRAEGNCVACHVVSSLTADFQGNIGPELNGAADRYTEAELRGIVADAKHRFEGSMMPSLYKTGPYIRPGDAFTGKAAQGELPPLLSAEQIEDVVAYLMTLKE